MSCIDEAIRANREAAHGLSSAAGASGSAWTTFGKVSVVDHALFATAHTRHHTMQMPGGG